MRISTCKHDPGYANFLEFVARTTVFLDGVEQKWVITADSDTQEIFRHPVDEHGHPKADPTDPEKLLIERVTGEVVIEIEAERT